MADTTKVVYAALAGNVLVAASKFVAASLSGSSAMLTEAIHSTADTVNQLLLLIGNKRSRAEPDATHAFGYGPEIYFWTFVVAVMVLLAGGGASIYEGLMQLRDPERIHGPVTSLVVLALALLFEGSSLAVGYREYRRIVAGRRVGGEHIGLWHFIKLSKDPNLYESILEDSAAVVGIAIAAVGVVLNAYVGWLWADGAASVAIGVLLVVDSYIIAFATRSLIAGESASPLLMQDIDRALKGLEPHSRVDSVATLQLGPRAVLVALTIRRDPDRPTSETEAHFDRLTRTLKTVDERVAHVLFRLA